MTADHAVCARVARPEPMNIMPHTTKNTAEV
jgi:hypothetical protein